MGIQGLLGVLKPLIKDCHVEQFRGKRVAVDGYCWLHKATYSCSIDLCNGKDNQAWIKYFLNMVDMLVYHQIEVYIVFDGKNLPAKQLVEASRGSSRQASLQKAREFEAAQDMKNAYIYYSRAVNVTPAMAARLIKIMKTSHPSVKCIVAPYEADAQLSYLSINDIVDLIISEDSDHIPYGCKDILFKLDGSGNCQRLLVSELYSTPLDGFDLRNFTPEMTLIMCIISGCDYLNSVKGVGLKNSYKLVSKQRTAASVLRNMRITGLLPLTSVHDSKNSFADVSPECFVLLPSNLLVYEFEFYKAITTFHHQAIYDPVLRKIKHISPIVHSSLPQCLQTAYPLPLVDLHSADSPSPAVLFDLPFLGSVLVSDEMAVAIAEGHVDPSTKEPFNLPEYLERPLSRNGSTGSLQTLHNNTSSAGAGSVNSGASNAIKKSTTLPSHVTSYKIHYNNQFSTNSNTFRSVGASATSSPVLMEPRLSVAEARMKAAANVSIVSVVKTRPSEPPPTARPSTAPVTSSSGSGSSSFGSAHKTLMQKSSGVGSSISSSGTKKAKTSGTAISSAVVRRTVTPSSNGSTSFYSYDSNGIAINNSDGNKRKGSQTINSFFSKTPKVESATPDSKGPGPSSSSEISEAAFVTPSVNVTPSFAASAVNDFDIYSVITIHSSASNSPIIESKKTSSASESSKAPPLHPNRSVIHSGSSAAVTGGGIVAKVSPYFFNSSASESLKRLNHLKIHQAQRSLKDTLLSSPSSSAEGSRHSDVVTIDLTPSEGTTQESEDSRDTGGVMSSSSGSAGVGFASFGYDESFSPPVPVNKLGYSSVGDPAGTAKEEERSRRRSGDNDNPFDMFQCEV